MHNKMRQTQNLMKKCHIKENEDKFVLTNRNLNHLSKAKDIQVT